MAHVGISQQLISDVKDSIARMANKERAMEIEVLHTKLPSTPQEIGYASLDTEQRDELFKMVWKEHADIRSRIPDNWCVSHNELVLRWNETREDGVPEDWRFKVRMGHGSNYWLPPTSSYYDPVRVASRPSFASKYVEYSRAEQLIGKAIKEKYDTIVSQVTGYLKSCRSLNAAIKALPDIKLYIPSEYLDRVGKRTERTVSAKAEEHAAVVDTTLLVSTAVMHKFLGAQA
jgi:hypothetical protein